MVEKKTIAYSDQDTDLEGFVVYPAKEKRPLVILCHAWRGRDEFICEKTEQMAQWGYVGFALDMYGKGVLGKSKEENAALKKPFVENRFLLQRRLLKGFDIACSLPYVDTHRIAVLGFGFGGMCALDLIRNGVDVKGAISVYGHFDAPGYAVKSIKSKILVLHGYNDPVATMSELDAFQQEMSRAGVDWQTHLYSDTLHAFATPTAHDLEAGILYHPSSAKRAWQAIENFLKEVLSSGVKKDV